jgi:hypothetical protein
MRISAGVAAAAGGAATGKTHAESVMKKTAGRVGVYGLGDDITDCDAHRERAGFVVTQMITEGFVRGVRLQAADNCIARLTGYYILLTGH